MQREGCTRMKKNVQGSTLIEVVVALAVVVIAIGIMSSAVTASAKMIERSKEYSNSSTSSYNGIINGDGDNNSYEETPVEITYSLGGVSIVPNGAVRKVTNGNVALLAFVPDDDTTDDGALPAESKIIPGTTVDVNVIHPKYTTAGNHKKLHYTNGTTIMYNDIYYYVNKNININHYDINADPYEIISDNMDKLIKFTGVNHTSTLESAQIGDTLSNGDTYYIYTDISPNYKYSRIS